MKLIFSLLLVLSLQIVSSTAQDIVYHYDDAGNRVKRKLFVLRAGARLASGHVQKKEFDDVDKKDEDLIDEKAFNDKMNALETKHGINVAPNPTSGAAIVTINNYKEQETAEAIIVDVNGRVVSNQKITTSSTSLDFSTYPAGVYMVKVNITNDALFYKVVKQ